MQTEVKSGAGFEQVLYFFITFYSPEGTVEVCKNNLRNFQSQNSGNLPTDEFCYQRFTTLTSPAKL